MPSLTEGGDPATLQKIDRLVSASSPSDALDSLNSLLVSLQNTSSNSNNNSNDDYETASSQLVSIIYTLSESVEFTTALCTLLSSSEIGPMVMEDGDSTASELLSQIISCLCTSDEYGSSNGTSSSTTPAIPRKTRLSILKKFLSQPSEGRLIHSLLDLLSPTSTSTNNNTTSSSHPSPTSLYARTNALQILSQLTLTLPTLLHSQILAAPNGLHRIVDLLSSDSSDDESIRNEALLVCTDLAKTNVASARLMIFSDTYQKVLLGIAQEEFRAGKEAQKRRYTTTAGRGGGGGLGWTVVVGDCLRLCIEMTRQVGMGADEFLGSRSLVDTLAGFLDLRGGMRFMYPVVEEGLGVEDGDDLDAILGAGSGAQGGSTGNDTNTKDGSDGTTDATTSSSVPYLTDEESSVVKLALELLQILILGDESSINMTNNETTSLSKTKLQSRQRSILSHTTLSSLLFDMALYTLPPPNSPHERYVSSVPPLHIQLASLDVMAALAYDAGEVVQSQILDKPSVYFSVAGVLERLMYLICTGGGGGSGGGVATMMRISMHALGVLRCVLSKKEASLMVWKTLAPPVPTTDGDLMGSSSLEQQQQQPVDTPEVQKLVNTLGGNLLHLVHSEIVKQMETGDVERMNLNIIGAAGALGVFLSNGAGETTREMLLRVPLPPQPPYLTNGGGGGGGEDNGETSSDQEQQQTNSLSSNNNNNNINEGNAFIPDTLVECILSYLEIIANDTTPDGGPQGKLSTQVTIALLRMLIEWIPSTPTLISALLSSASSVALGVLLQKKRPKGERNRASTPMMAQALTGILLGLCMENMGAEEEIGGWSRSSIMTLINVGMGISKFTQLLEGIKPYIALTSSSGNITSSTSTDVSVVGPWTCCKWERRVFTKWYEENVIIIRRRAVQQLTLSSNSDNSDGESDDEDGTTTEGEKRDLKSMSRLISQQTTEIDDLHQKVADTERTLEAQSGEMKMLQKRMESNPTQLDDMLDEYLSKIAELEKENTALGVEAAKRDEEHVARLTEKDGQISDLQKVAEEGREEILVVCGEMDIVKQELIGLSSAYASLETEYNRVVTSANAGATAPAQTGETSEQQTSSQSNGDHTTEGSVSSPEFNALRSENAKLKNDVRAANDWIQLAVKKVEDAGKMNSTLQAEVQQLRLESDTAGSTTAQTTELLIPGQDTGKIQVLNQKIVTMEQAMNKHVSEIGVWRTKAEGLEISLESSDRKFNELFDQTNESKVNKMNEDERQRTELTDKVTFLQRELTEKSRAVQSMGNNTSEIDAWRSKAQVLELDLRSAEYSFNELKAQAKEEKFKNAIKIDKMSKVEEHSVELSDKVRNLQQELIERNMAVQSMSEQISEIDVWRSKAEVLKKNLNSAEYSLAQTREGQVTNTVKIEKMNEVEKHRTELSNKVSHLQQELTEKNIIVQDVEKRIHEAGLQLSEAIASTADGKEEVSKLREEVKALSEANKVAQDWMAKAMKHHESLKQQLAVAVQNNSDLSAKLQDVEESVELERPSVTKISHLENRVSSLTNTRDEVREKLITLEQQLDEKEKELSESFSIEEQKAQKRADEIQALTEKLVGRDCETQKLQSSLSALQTEVDAEHEKVISLEKSSEEMNASYTLVEQEKRNIQHEIRLVTAERDEQSTAFISLQNEVETLKVDNDCLATERDDRVVIIEDMRSKLNDFQIWTNTAQERISELEVEKDDAYKRMKSFEEETNNLSESAAKIKEECAFKQVEEERVKTDQEKLQSEILSLKLQISNLDEANLALTDDNKVLDNERADLFSKVQNLTGLEENISQQNNKVAQLIDELGDARQKFDQALNEKEVTVCQVQEESNQLQSDLQTVSSQLEQHKSAAINTDSEWKSHCSSLETASKNLSVELQHANSNIEVLKGEVSTEKESWQDESNQLQSDLQIAISQLERYKIEAADANSQWQSHCLSLETASKNLSMELQHANSKFDTLKEEFSAKNLSMTEVENLLEMERQRASDLDYQNKATQQDFESRIEELGLSINEYVSTIDKFQVQLDERDGAVVCAEERLEELTTELVESADQSEDVVYKWQENSQQLEATISELETTLETQHKEANGAISQWEIRCNALSEQVESLEEQHTGDTLTKMSSLELQLKEKNIELQQKNSNLLDLDSLLSNMKIELSKLQDAEIGHNIVKYELCKLKESNGKLSQQVSSGQERLRNELSAKTELNLEMQNILQEKEDALSEFDAMKKLAIDRKGRLDSDEGTLSEFKAKLINSQSLLDINTAKLESVEGQKSDLERRLQDDKKFCSDRIEELEGEKSLLNNLVDNHESEVRDMKHTIVELEDELLEANDALQAHITDEVSVRATEMATKLLRAQIKVLREKSISEHDAFVAEKEARLSAQEEIERMKLDVSLLIHNGDNGEPIDGQIRKLTSKAANAIVRKDREEIDGLRSSLDRSMQELGSCRAKERDAEERAANSRLHLSVCDQELIAAKSDVSFLKQAMDDLKIDSTSTRSSLEDRIKSIDYDRAVLVRSHANERETLKAEITRGQMERERLVHTLSESEKANSTLVYSTTAQKDADGVSSNEVELAKLRVERAQLLASASENGAKFERRIREAVAANASSVEAEIILEKELKESAELALSEMQRQCQELSSRLEKTENIPVVTSSPSKDSDETDKLKMNMEHLELEMSKIRNENSVLHEKLEQVEEDAITETARLKDECRHVEMKYNEISREELFEAAVAAEVARINADSSSERKLQNDMNGANNELISSIDDDDEYKESDMDANEMYSYVVELKDAVKEERESYHDLLTEHEDLLALLAQQDLERASLQAALSDFGGENAVERAVTEAEEKAVEQFGKYIRVK